MGNQTLYATATSPTGSGTLKVPVPIGEIEPDDGVTYSFTHSTSDIVESSKPKRKPRAIDPGSRYRRKQRKQERLNRKAGRRK